MVVMESPPCSLHRPTCPDKVVEPHVRACVKTCWKQFNGRRHFSRERPTQSEIWKRPEVLAPMTDSRMLLVKGPLYRFARTDRNKDTHSTNHQLCDVSSRYIAHALSTKSVTKAWHRRIRNQTRLACCSIDVPPHPMPELLRALQKQLDEDGVELHCFSAGPTDDERELIDSEWCETESERSSTTTSGETCWILCKSVQGQQLEMDWVMRQKVSAKVYPTRPRGTGQPA